MLSIKTKITALTVCIMAIAMGIAAALGVIALKNMGNRDADQLLLLVCETGQRNLDSYFQGVEQSASAVAAYVEADLDGLEDDKLQAHLARVNTIFDKMIYNTNGVLTYYYRIDPAISKNVKGFWYVNTKEGLLDHEVTDITRYDTRDTSKLVWFTVPKNTGKAVWQPPYITENLGAKVISYNVPIYYHHQFVGVIGIEIDYSLMAKLVNNITLYKNGYAFLNDKEGNIIYHPRMDVFTLENQPQVPEGMLSEGKFIHYTFEGVEKKAVWLPLSNGMHLNLTVPVSEIDADWHNWSIKIIVIFTALLAAFVLLIKLLIGRTLDPK